jgi:hypothetical protein
MVGVDLRICVFAHGQLYVVFSRRESYETIQHTKNCSIQRNHCAAAKHENDQTVGEYR